MNIPDKKLLAVYNNMIAKLNAEYPQRFWRWLGIFQKPLDTDINKADGDINKIWLACLEGKSTLLVFIGGLKIYEGLVRRGYGLYNATQRKAQ